MTPTIRLKRAYDSPEKEDGARILVDRVWPRGVRKEDLKLDAWLRDVAPSDALRKWFGHDPQLWSAFKQKYRKELDAAPEAVAELRETIGDGPATLVFAAKDEERNNAVALREYLDDNG